MKHLLLLLLIPVFTQFGYSQSIDPGLKDCLEGNYTWTDNRSKKHHITLSSSLTAEYTGYIYEGGSKNPIGNKPFVLYGKWGADENTVNILTGTFKNADKYKDDKESPEYYAWHYQNSGYKGAYNLDEGTIVFMGNTYSKDSGPCSQTRLKEHETKRENQSEGAQPEKPAPTLVYTGRESDLDKLKDQYLETFSTAKSYSAYTSGENIKRLGIDMAKDFSESLNSITDLTANTDPNAMLLEFNQKVLSIESMEANFTQESNQYFFNTGQQIGQSLSDGNYETAAHEFAGILNANKERKAAEAELAKKKQALYKQRRDKMSSIYWKTVDYTNHTQKNFVLAAAYAESEAEQDYNLDYYQNLECFKTQMKNNFSLSNTNWLNNSCSVPQKSNLSGLKNNLASKDIYYAKLAARKYDYFQSSGFEDFRTAAIHYQSASIKHKPTANSFIQLAKYYQGVSSVLELSNLLAAQAYNSKSINSELKNRLAELESLVEKEIKTAINYNSKEYILTFLHSGLDKVIKIDNQNILSFAISLDNPDAVQIILNRTTEKMAKVKKGTTLKKAVMLCSVHNSSKSMQRLIDLGVSTDFVLNRLTPIKAASKVNSDAALAVLLRNTSHSDKYSELIKNSFHYNYHTFQSFVQKEEFANAGAFLNALPNETVLKNIVHAISDSIIVTPSLIHSISNSDKALSYIKSNAFLKNKFSNSFYFHFFYSLIPDLHAFIDNDLVYLDENLNINGEILSVLNSSKHGINTYPYYFLPTIDSIKNNFNSISYITNKIPDNFENNFESKSRSYINWFDMFIFNNALDYWLDENWNLKADFIKGHAPWDHKSSNLRGFVSFAKTISKKPIFLFNEDQVQMLDEFKKISSCIPGQYSNFYHSSRAYMYYPEGGEDVEIKALNEILDLPAHMKKNFMMTFEPKNLLKAAIYKRDTALIYSIIDHYQVDLNTKIEGEPIFLLLAQSMNWRVLNKLLGKNKISDLTQVDRYGNTVFHYVAEYPYVYYHTTTYKISYLLSNLYNSDFDRSVLQIKNKDNMTPWKLFKKRRVLIYKWSKSYLSTMSKYLKP